MRHTLRLDEGNRQMVLMALAHLAVERPGWDDALNRLALQIDNAEGGRASLYESFRQMHRPLLVSPVAQMDRAKCSQVTCSDLSTHRFTWPGSPEQPSCYEHAITAQRLASAMGFELEIRPLAEP
jgi:hypothetical protein